MTSHLSLYFLRHGETAHSRDNVFCGADTDAPLTPRGREMAKEFANRYCGRSWSAIYSSPLIRARETIQPLCSTLQHTAEYREELIELRYGSWENKTPDEIIATDNDLFRQWNRDPVSFSPPGGENVSTLAARGLKVVDEIKMQHPSGDVLIVSHRGTIRAVLCALLGLDLRGFRTKLDCPVCSLSVVEFRSEGPMLRKLADISHLS